MNTLIMDPIIGIKHLSCSHQNVSCKGELMLELLVILKYSSLHIEFPWFIWGFAATELIWKLMDRASEQI